MKFKYYFIITSLLLIGMIVNGSIDKNVLNEYLEVTGIGFQIKKIPSSLLGDINNEVGIKDTLFGKNYLDKLSDSLYEAMYNRLLKSEYDNETMNKIIQWYETPLGKKIRELNINSSNEKIENDLDSSKIMLIDSLTKIINISEYIKSYNDKFVYTLMKSMLYIKLKNENKRTQDIIKYFSSDEYKSYSEKLYKKFLENGTIHFKNTNELMYEEYSVLNNQQLTDFIHFCETKAGRIDVNISLKLMQESLDYVYNNLFIAD